jgi:hypothetical protein
MLPSRRGTPATSGALKISCQSAPTCTRAPRAARSSNEPPVIVGYRHTLAMSATVRRNATVRWGFTATCRTTIRPSVPARGRTIGLTSRSTSVRLEAISRARP